MSGLRGDVEVTNTAKCAKVDLGKENQGLRVTCHQPTSSRTALKTDSPPPVPRPPVLVKSNPLKGLAPLQKRTFSSNIPGAGPGAIYYNADPSFFDGVVHDYVRITGACPLEINLSRDHVNTTHVETCIAICKQVDAKAAGRNGSTAQQGMRAPGLSFIYAPWHHKFFEMSKSRDPQVGGEPEAAEVQAFTAQMRELQAVIDRQNEALGGTDIELEAVLLDSELFDWRDNSTAAFKAALTRKHDLIYNATVSVFPRARLEMYDRGSVGKSDTNTWATAMRHTYTLDERGSRLGIALYTVPELTLTRESFAHTYALALRHNMTEVTPWIALGMGYRRFVAPHENFQHPTPGVTKAIAFDPTWNYEPVCEAFNTASEFTDLDLTPPVHSTRGSWEGR